MKTLEELRVIREKNKPQLNIRKENHGATRIFVYMSTAAIDAGARDVLMTFVNTLEEKNVLDTVALQKGAASEGNDVKVDVVKPNGETVTYVGITPEKAVRIVDEHIINNNVIAEFKA